MAGIASFSGLASGIQWKDIVDQLMTVEKGRILDPVTTEATTQATRRTAWTELNGLLTTLSDSARNVGLSGGFNAVKANTPTSATTGRALLTATGGILASPGTYGVEVLSLAQSEKLAGGVVSDPAAALGLAGSFTVNGQSVTLEATDSLRGVRDKISALNSGASATGVTASILTTSTGANRLVLSSDKAGSTGITLAGDTSGVARDLGFLSSQTKQMSSATVSVAIALGVTMPPPASIKVNGRTINVDLTIDSLSSIAAKIQAAGGAAEVVTEKNGGVDAYRLSISGSVVATSDSGSADTLTTLGIDVGDRRAVRQTMASAVLNGTSGVAAGSTLLTDLQGTSGSYGIVAGDAINIRGRRADGSTVTTGLTIGASDTIDTLLAKINSATDGYGTGATTATASIGPDGKIRLTDATGGDSRLTFSLELARAAGGTSDLGGTTTETVGRQRQLVAGSDAQLKVDGALVTRSSNTVTDAISGVTLNLQQAEAGTTATLTISQDIDAQTDRVKAFVKAYNAVSSFYTAQQADGQPLKSNNTLRGALNQINSALRTQVDAAGSFSKLAISGVAFDRYGQLQIDEKSLRSVLASDQTAVATLFGAAGVGGAVQSATSLLTRFGDGTVSSTVTSIDKRVETLAVRTTDMQRRLDLKRAALEEQFAKMEAVLSALNTQGTYLSSQFAAMSK
jgi:flagellar hook-associated protein 2